jgi:asparagine synthase (glutamine-hydrolysing)
MSAFAAILSTSGGPVQGSEQVAAVLAAAAGRAAAAWQSGACRLISAPFHDWEAATPIHDPRFGIGAVGEVCLENRAHWARIAEVPADTGDLALAATLTGRTPGSRLPPLTGEYAFAAWDPGERALTCARDPLGIRTLFVAAADGVVVVSNLFSAVMSHPSIPRDVDAAALVRFLAAGSMTRTVATPLSSVRLVPEGHVLTVHQDGATQLRRHWEPPAPSAWRSTDATEVIEGYREVLKIAVRDRVAGRRTTVFLSGGIDSTTLAVTAADCGVSMRAMTFEYHLRPVPEETRLARDVAERLGIPIDVVHADADEPLEAERRGQLPPFPVDEATLSNWRAVLAQAARYSSLAIDGEDGDTLMAPPPWAELAAVQSLPSTAWQSARYLATERQLPHLGLRLRRRLRGEPVSEPWPAWLTPDARRLVRDAEDDRVLGQRPQWLGPAAHAWVSLLTNVPRDFALTICPDVTKQRVTVTLPLMDSRVIAFVLAMPPVPWRQRKHLARRAFADRLPASVIARPKTPLRGYLESMAAQWRATHSDVCRVPRVVQYGWLDQPAWCDAMRTGDLHAAWRVLMLESWLGGDIIRA